MLVGGGGIGAGRRDGNAVGADDEVAAGRDPEGPSGDRIELVLVDRCGEW
jgi:hypothetical protein